MRRGAVQGAGLHNWRSRLCPCTRARKGLGLDCVACMVHEVGRPIALNLSAAVARRVDAVVRVRIVVPRHSIRMTRRICPIRVALLGQVLSEKLRVVPDKRRRLYLRRRRPPGNGCFAKYPHAKAFLYTKMPNQMHKMVHMNNAAKKAYTT